ncbi:MAG: YraN family protein [Cytophagaceae bacterium]|nr:YraN family protein [Cytophagaceae bacterium]MDW8455484.1 YraN family protein [Cytophagaceae bacterium]
MTDSKKSSHLLSGAHAEQLACELLTKNGFIITSKNYRYGRYEVDIIACKEDLLVFAEVKKRKNDTYGNPEEFVDAAKRARMLVVAEHYIHEKNWQGKIRFDIIAFTGNEDPVWFEDVIS